jgi:hypothetical protein
MARYLISFNDGAMDHIPDEDMPAVANAAHAVIDVPTREAAYEWAAKIAVACRCAQEVREFGPDPELDEMLRQR